MHLFAHRMLTIFDSRGKACFNFALLTEREPEQGHDSDVFLLPFTDGSSSPFEDFDENYIFDQWVS